MSKIRVYHWLFAMLVALLLSGSASAQLEGRLYLDKDEYLAGEPIFLHFDLKNNGSEPIQVFSGNSYALCGGYRIEISADPSADTSSCPSHGAGASCAVGGGWIIAPGETRHDKVLLNYEHDLSKPGLYQIRANRTLSYGPPGATWAISTSGLQVKTDARFNIRVENGNVESLIPTFQPYVADLQSKDKDRQREAAIVIGSLAPAFLEDTILSMQDSPVTRPFALIGLRHLNTPRSREALAAVVQGTTGYSYEKVQAIKYLSEMEDKQYFPLLLAEAKQQEPNQAREYVLAAAQLGGEDAMPYVSSLLASTDAFSRANGVMALPLTGSRHAVPMLIDLLRNPSVDVGRLASIGLIRLTHRSPFEGARWFSDSPSNEYQAWFHWWMLGGKEAPIYGPSQCGKVEPLQ